MPLYYDIDIKYKHLHWKLKKNIFLSKIFRFKVKPNSNWTNHWFEHNSLSWLNDAMGEGGWMTCLFTRVIFLVQISLWSPDAVICPSRVLGQLSFVLTSTVYACTTGHRRLNFLSRYSHFLDVCKSEGW